MSTGSKVNKSERIRYSYLTLSLLRSVQTMQLCSLGQGTVSPWSIAPRCPIRLPGCCKCFQQCRITGTAELGSYPTLLDLEAIRHCWTWELSDIVGLGSYPTLLDLGAIRHCCTWELSDIVGLGSGTWELSDIVGSTCNSLGQRGAMGDTVPCPKEQSCIVWTDLNSEVWQLLWACKCRVFILSSS